MAFNVISEIYLDMAFPNVNIVNAVQYDSSGRVVKAHLLNNGEAWAVPSGVYPVIRYRKSDRIGGFYDTDENNAYAISYESNRTIINITLALQALTTTGNVDIQINFYNNEGQRVTTFAFKLKVQASVLPDDKIISSEYYNALSATLAQSISSIESVIRVADYTADIANRLPEIVSDWLSSNITNPSSPPLDRSLSIEGAAAPADLVGMISAYESLKIVADKFINQNGAVQTSTSSEIVEIDDPYGWIIDYSGATYWSPIFGYYENGTIINLCSTDTPRLYDHLTIPITDINIKKVRCWSLKSGQKYSDTGYSNGIEVKIGGNIHSIYQKKTRSNLITVGNDNADFFDIQKAINYATNNYDVLHEDVTIFIKRGIYIIPYRANSTSNSPDALIKSNNRISIIGEDRDHTILRRINTPAYCNSVLGIGGACTVENLTIESLWNDDGSSPNIKRTYCLHNDYGYDYSYDTPYVTKVKNCKLYSECQSPLGGGLWQNQTQVYENCEFIWNPKSANWSNLGAFYVHGPADTRCTKASIIIRDCVCKSIGNEKAIYLPNTSGPLLYTDIDVTLQRTIGITDGNEISNISKSTHKLTKESALNNVDSWNY